MADVPFEADTYPFKRIISSNQLRGAELIPSKIIRYLLDMPDYAGYVPIDDNSRPRVRLAKYLWYDDSFPLNNPLPTPQEKLSMYFDPSNPAINTDEDKTRHPKGYRIFPQRIIGQSSIEAKTVLKIYPGRILDDTDFRSVITMNVEIWCNVNLIGNIKTNAIDRSFDIEQCIRESLAGVDISGVGTCRFSRQASSYNGSEILYTNDTQCGRILYFSTSWAEGGGETIKNY